MMKQVFIFVNGIHTFPGASDNWNGKAATATMSYGPSCAVGEKVEYFSTALTRTLLQKKRADKLIKVLNFYPMCHTTIVAHSNGADVALDALQRTPMLINRLILISPAVSWDCQKNGLDFIKKNKRADMIEIWIAGRDKALELGGSFFGRLFGFGALGLRGFKSGTLTDAHTLRIRREDTFGHSDWFIDSQFHDTMMRIWDPTL